MESDTTEASVAAAAFASSKESRGQVAEGLELLPPLSRAVARRSPNLEDEHKREGGDEQGRKGQFHT